MKPLRVLIDGMNATHRFRHAYAERTITRKDGEHSVGALHGMLDLLTQLQSNFPTADEIIVAWEGPNSEHVRRAIFSRYKQTRRKRRVESLEEQRAFLLFLREQVPAIQAMLRALRIPQLKVTGCEADDVIAALAQTGRGSAESLIVSTDHDLLQLVERGNCRVYNPQTKRLYYETRAGTLEDGSAEVVAPSPLIYLWRRLVVGDSSDTISGVPGVGEKTAALLFNEREQPRETLWDYMRRKRWFADNARWAKVTRTNIDSILARNLNLMSLRAPDWIAPGDLPDILRAQHAAVYARTIKSFSPDDFLSWPSVADPSPWMRFLQRNGIAAADDPLRARQVLDEFKTLHARARAIFGTEERILDAATNARRADEEEEL